MEDLIGQLSFHTPAFPEGWRASQAIGVAIVVGISLAVLCRIYYRGFLLWGFLVGFLGFIFLWLVLSVLAVKWALILVAAIGLPIAVMFYVDEHSFVTAQELESGATSRDANIQRLFEKDGEAAGSIAETLNLGLDDSTEDWPKESAFRGIPKGVVHAAGSMLFIGYFLIGLFAYLIYQWPNPDVAVENIEPMQAEGRIDGDRSVDSVYESTCSDLTGIELERCLTINLEKAEEELGELRLRAAVFAEQSARASGFPSTVVSTDKWKEALALSHKEWLDHREASCDMIRFLAWQGSGTGGFIQTCRLRMTVERIDAMKKYGSGYPDYLPSELETGQ